MALRRLHESGVRGWVVGGALRDLLSEVEARDFDLVVDASLERAAEVLPRSRRIDAAVPFLLLRGSPRIELTSLRGGATRLEDDLRLRDFTLNAIAFDAHERKWVDPLGGQRDLQERRLRATDAPRVFVDDALRILRGTRLACEFGLSIEAETEAAMQRSAWRLHDCAGERIRDELYRMLRLEVPPLAELRQIGALAVVLPELLRTVGVAQNAHHVDDVYTHTLRVCALCPPEPELRLAALLHDCAKPEAKRFSARRNDFTFHRHESLARTRVEQACSRLRLSRAAGERVARLVRHHLLFPDRLQTDAALRRMLRRVGADLIDDLIVLRRADYASRTAEGRAPDEWLQIEERIRASADSPCLAISGADVIRELGIEPGERVGQWLRRATRRILESPEENDRARLIAWLRTRGKGEE